MSLYYITGPPGSGKSTIQKELVARGYDAYDLDQPRFGGPVNLKTGKSTTVPPLDQRAPQWFAEHEWRVSRRAVEELKHQSQNQLVYVCGTASTDNLIWDLFDTVYYLDIDEKSLRERLAHRQGNDFGKTEHELILILERYHLDKQRLKSLEFTPVNAGGSIEETVNSITKLTAGIN